MPKIKERLFQELARKLIEDLTAGKYPTGSRLPAERDLAQYYGVSRNTVRKAVLALEFQGFVSVRLGSGAYVTALDENKTAGFHVTAFELTEARWLFEGEAAALAAIRATEDEVAELELMVGRIARKRFDPEGIDRADQAFHLAVARASHNPVVFDTIEHLWSMRYTCHEAALLQEKAFTVYPAPALEERIVFLAALRARDPDAARAAMRSHIAAELDSLLIGAEERAQKEIRRATAAKRARYFGAAS